MKRKVMDRYRRGEYGRLSFIWTLRLGLLVVWGGVIAVLFLLGGCTQAEVEGESEEVTEVNATFYLNVLSTLPPVTRSLTFSDTGTSETDSLPATVRDSIQTKATSSLTEADESKIYTLWVGQYGSDGVLLYHSYFNSAITSSDVDLRLKVTLTDCHVYFVANTADLTATASTETALTGLTLQPVTDTGVPVNNRCIMIGNWTGTVNKGGTTGNVDMKRLTAKITLNYSFGGSGFSFDVSSVKLYNVPDRSRYVEPVGQLSGINYVIYEGTKSNTGATIYWYLPENKAGTVSGANIITSEKKKTGKGVSNATFIDISGTARQGNVTYEKVVFRLYPGSNMNDYTVGRNCHYIVNIRLIGIDLSDDRVTVGTIPDIANPDNMSPEAGSTKSVQITARPGQSWSVQLPTWLSATMSGQSFASGAIIASDGPQLIEFKAANTNPDGAIRSQSFTVYTPSEAKFAIMQNPSSLSASADKTSFDAKDNGSTCRVTATAGLKFTATPANSWLGLTGSYNDITTTGSQQTFGVQPAVNTGSLSRSGSIGIKAGNLSKTIDITQKGATLSVSGGVTLEPMKTTGRSSSFKSTSGLSWVVTKDQDWLTLTSSPTNGTNNTTGNDQFITYDVAVNGTSAAREATLTVKVGNAVSGTDGNLNKTIKVKQNAGWLNIDLKTSWSYVFNATKGLSFNAESNADWLVLSGEISGTTTGSDQSFQYRFAKINPTANRRGGNITIKAGDMSKMGIIYQTASEFGVYTWGYAVGGGSKEVPTSSVNLNYDGSVSYDPIFIKGTLGLEWATEWVSGDKRITPNPSEGILGEGGGSGLIATGTSINWNTSNNTDSEARIAVFKFYVKGGDGSHDKLITVTQDVLPNKITINQTLVDDYMNVATTQKLQTKVRPFFYDPGNGGAKITNFKGDPNTLKLMAAYRLEVDNTMNITVSTYNGSVNKCISLGTGWRIPTHLELYAIWRELYGNSLLLKFNQEYYMSSSIFSGGTDHIRIYMKSGTFHSSGTPTYVRCVREIQ